MSNAPRDDNRVVVIQAVSKLDLSTPSPIVVVPATGAVVVELAP
jgi:hypothetical protein